MGKVLSTAKRSALLKMAFHLATKLEHDAVLV